MNFNSSANLPGLQAGVFSPQTTLTSSSGGTTDGSLTVDWIAYQKPIILSQDLKLGTYIAASGGNWNDYVKTFNPYFQDYDGGNGSLSAFSQENPIYRIGGGAGAGLSLNFKASTILTIGYFAGSNPNSPTQGSGLTNGSYALLGQVSTKVANSLNLAFTYVNAYQSQGAPIFNLGSNGINSAIVGSQLGNGLVTDAAGNVLIDSGKVINSYGGEISFSPFKGVSFSAFGTYSNVNFVGDPTAGTGFRGTGEVWTYGGGLAFTDLLKQGSILGIFAGVQPYFGNVSTNIPETVVGYTTASPVQVELFYKYPVTNNISITPGVIWLSNPTQTVNSNSQVIGVLRGTFSF